MHEQPNSASLKLKTDPSFPERLTTTEDAILESKFAQTSDQRSDSSFEMSSMYCDQYGDHNFDL